MRAARLCGILLLAAGLVVVAAGLADSRAQSSAAEVTVLPAGLPLDDESKCLALAVYWEGKSETQKGQLAVAHTVLNRVGHPAFPDTICGVVSQQSDAGRRSCQFSWWCDGKRDEPRDEDEWQDAVDSAHAAMLDGAKDPTQGALYFHSARAKTPKWAKSRKRLVRIGDHIFYR
jgi:spore germination cell wall hydrolase CwlJ-like protein